MTFPEVSGAGYANYTAPQDYCEAEPDATDVSDQADVAEATDTAGQQDTPMQGGAEEAGVSADDTPVDLRNILPPPEHGVNFQLAQAPVYAALPRAAPMQNGAVSPAADRSAASADVAANNDQSSGLFDKLGNAFKGAATAAGNAVQDTATAVENVRSDIAHEVDNVVKGAQGVAQEVARDVAQNPVVSSVLTNAGNVAHEVAQNPVVSFVLNGVRTQDDAKNQFGSWIESGKTYLENKIDQSRAWLSENGGVAGHMLSDTIGFGEGVVLSVYDLGKGVVQLADGAASLINPLEWAANPQANLARLETAGSAVSTLGKLTSPVGWILDPQGNAHMVQAMGNSIVTSFQNDPSKATGYAVGTIVSMLVPVGGGAAAATNAVRGAEVAETVVRTEQVVAKTEQVTAKLEQAAASTMTATEQASERVAVTATQQASEHAAVMGAGQASEQTTMTVAGQVSEHTTMTAAGQAGEQATMTAAGQTGEHASMTAAGQAGEQATVTVAGQAGEQATMTVAGQTTTAAADLEHATVAVGAGQKSEAVAMGAGQTGSTTAVTTDAGRGATTASDAEAVGTASATPPGGGKPPSKPPTGGEPPIGEPSPGGNNIPPETDAVAEGTMPKTTGFGRISINEFEPPALSVDKQGFLTNGTYRLDAKAQSIHQTGAADGKSQFFHHVDSDSLTLDAAAYADKMGLWNPQGKAKVTLSEQIGVTGKTGTPTNVINLYRSSTGLVHSAPGN